MSSETITRNDLTNILNEVLPTPRYGAIYSSSWTADSSNANDVHLTGNITLPKGTYVITIKFPATSTSLWASLKYGDNGGVGTLLDSFAIVNGGTCSAHTVIVNIPSTITIWVASGMSASCTYTYKERGGLRAIQISESSISDNEADYIVEQGTSGIWTYRKWNSGVAECWGHTTWSITSWSTWGSIYYSTYLTYQYYPTDFFISTPVLHISAYCDNQDTFLLTTAQASDYSIATPRICLLRGTNGGSGTGMAYYYAKGTWK